MIETVWTRPWLLKEIGRLFLCNLRGRTRLVESGQRLPKRTQYLSVGMAVPPLVLRGSGALELLRERYIAPVARALAERAERSGVTVFRPMRRPRGVKRFDRITSKDYGISMLLAERRDRATDQTSFSVRLCGSQDRPMRRRPSPFPVFRD